ncbi:hypothetical protein S100892_02065 [Pediococcus pentosaceus]|uniref:Uncharacterized protein n=1 Tax=Pediococcus pentosaceus TaxID=1255 RepID=A0A1Y0VT31_PEDPE|nr:hypothetical protein S100892_02065 [Pediococcus pentosaceus]
MNKKGLLILVMAVLWFWGINRKPLSVRAATDWGEQFITNVELRNRKDQAQTTFGLYDNMKIHWNFNIPVSKRVTAGDTMTLKVPDSLKLVSNVKFDVTDGRGNIIGKVQVLKPTNKVEVKLTEYVEHYVGGVKGALSVRTQWNYSKVDQNQVQLLNWGAGRAAQIKIKPNGGPNPNETLYQWSWYDVKDPTLIHWRVRVNYAKQNLNQVDCTELIGDHQKLLTGSIEVMGVAFDDQGKDFEVTATCPKVKIMTNGTKGFTVGLGKIKQTYVIDYQTRISSVDQHRHYHSQGDLTAANLTSQRINTYVPESKGVGTGQGWQNSTEKLSNTQSIKTGYIQKDRPVFLAEEKQAIIKNFLMVGASLLALIGWFIYRRRK